MGGPRERQRFMGREGRTYFDFSFGTTPCKNNTARRHQQQRCKHFRRTSLFLCLYLFTRCVFLHRYAYNARSNGYKCMYVVLFSVVNDKNISLLTRRRPDLPATIRMTYDNTSNGEWAYAVNTRTNGKYPMDAVDKPTVVR